jgi:hypothetical protein
MSTEQATVEQQEQWLEEPAELPRRPRRRRLLTPIPLALTGALLIACGFIGGVLVEKDQNSSSSSSGGASSFAARFASLRAASAGGSGASAGASNGSARAAGLFGAGAAGAGGPGATVGQVSYVSGSTLYVTGTEGNTVKVKTSDASTVSKTVKADVKSIHPGETVIVTGSTGANGAVQAESIRVSEAGASGGLGALFGGGLRGGAGGSQGAGASSGGRTSGSGSGTSGSSGEPALFGK